MKNSISIKYVMNKIPSQKNPNKLVFKHILNIIFFFPQIVLEFPFRCPESNLKMNYDKEIKRSQTWLISQFIFFF